MVEESAAKRARDLIMGTAENSSDGSQLRILLLLILLASIGISGYSIYVRSQYTPPEILEDIPQPATADRTRLNNMIKNLTVANDARANSMELATALASMARYPFVAEKITQTTTTQDFAHVVIIPPFIQVKATMTLEKRAVAVLDIEGEPRGKIYKVGDRFADNKGRVSRIVPQKVTITYENKEFIYTP